MAVISRSWKATAGPEELATYVNLACCCHLQQFSGLRCRTLTLKICLKAIKMVCVQVHRQHWTSGREVGKQIRKFAGRWSSSNRYSEQGKQVTGRQQVKRNGLTTKAACWQAAKKKKKLPLHIHSGTNWRLGAVGKEQSNNDRCGGQGEKSRGCLVDKKERKTKQNHSDREIINSIEQRSVDKE